MDENTLSILDGVKLDACLDDIHGTQRSMGDGAADTTSQRTLHVVHEVVLLVALGYIVLGWQVT